MSDIRKMAIDEFLAYIRDTRADKGQMQRARQQYGVYRMAYEYAAQGRLMNLVTLMLGVKQRFTVWKAVRDYEDGLLRVIVEGLE